MQVNTKELNGVALDWAVAKCEGEALVDGCLFTKDPDDTPSTDWAQGGQIIEREGITVAKAPNGWVAYFRDRLFDDGIDGWHQQGPTLLIAAMRCYVASRLGDTVEIPDELI